MHEIGIFVGPDIAWRIWANDITKMPVHQQESLVTSPPPESIRHIFRHIPENEAQRMTRVHRGLRIAEKTSATIAHDLDAYMESLNTFGQALRGLFTMFEGLVSEAKSMVRCLSSQQRIVNAARIATSAEETPASAAIISELPDQEDVDHMEP
jgi:hypothetical protein